MLGIDEEFEAQVPRVRGPTEHIRDHLDILTHSAIIPSSWAGVEKRPEALSWVVAYVRLSLKVPRW